MLALLPSFAPAGPLLQVKYSKVVGHGMNAAELARNKQLDSFFVRNLNKEPDGWALESGTFDAGALRCHSRHAAVANNPVPPPPPLQPIFHV